VNALEIRGLCKTYKVKKGRLVVALSALDLEIPKGEVFGFLGPNGAGKSTTIKSIMGLIKPSSGEMMVAGIPITDPTSRRKIGYLPENPSFYEFLSGKEYLVFIGKSFQMPNDLIEQQVKVVLQRMELSEAADRPIRSYSKGMVQRLGLAQTLIHDPDLFILDEPMSGLDPLGRVLVKRLINELKQQGKTIFFSTHITADVEAVCDRVGVIVNGELRAVDKVEHILEKGIEGYNVHIRSTASDNFFPDFASSEREPGVREYYVPRTLFKKYMELVVKSDCEVDLVEPVRRDIETFFLELVEKGNICQ
jgi:ABC-2 type transport system ATP-binding protein